MSTDPVSNTTTPTTAIAKKLAHLPPHVRIGLDAYRAALAKRQDWHRAVIAAIEAAESAIIQRIRGDGDDA